MAKRRSIRDLLSVKPTKGQLTLADIDPGTTPGVRKKTARGEMKADQEKLRQLQERLYAEGKRSLLLVLQGMDTSGKDGTIIHVIGAVDPQGVKITGFKAPTEEERRHDYLWRIKNALPTVGEIGIFNRSHYEDVLIVRVKNLVPESVWSKRYNEINRFEREVIDSGTTIVKICLHISFDEQRKRLLARLLDPTKRWKFKPSDLEERSRWSDYQVAYDAALFRCSTPKAPWYVVPANKKWYRNWAITRILIETLEELDPRYPEPDLDLPALTERLSPSAKP
ncbi:MAG: polyphosphate kinase 2 family protein [Chloroflexota bacterium]|nr:polyphosphate kinase 2 family protein [Chloroflexota bacterium]